MMSNPALQSFLGQMGDEFILAQVLIRRKTPAFELLHIEDREASVSGLRTIKSSDARALAQFTAAGEFRPLKAAPTLPAGWLIRAASAAELELALSGLYPGALADWHAAQSPTPPVTGYRAFTERQSGMYRITAKLTDAQAAGVIRQTCAATQCLKHRLWTVPALAPDSAAEKSLIPCLEPCAVLLESARKAAKIVLQGTCETTDNG